jgi:hypothetical protein
MKLAEVTRRWDADKKCAQAERNDVDCRPRIENTDALDQQIRNHRFEESSDNVDRCRGETAPWRFCKGTLKGLSHYAADKMRNGICGKSAAKEMRHKPKPIHNAALLSASSEMISCVDPVSPMRGKTFRML